MPNVTYPLDTSGISPSNLVINEIHTVAESQFRDYYFIVPNFSPFFIDNFSITYTYESSSRTLQEDVDYSFALPYVAGTRTTGKVMYGAVTLHNLNMNGVLSITYQTVGGDQIADRLYVLSLLADKAYNPRTTIWDLLTNVPNAFPPVPHYQDYDQYYGQEELVTALGEIRDALANQAINVSNQLSDILHLIGVNGLSDFLRLTGGTLTGPLYLAEDPAKNMEAVTKQYVDNNFIDSDKLATYMSNYVTSQTLTSLLDEIKAYVQVVTSNSAIQASLTQFKKYVEARLTALESSSNQDISRKADITYVDQKYDDLLSIITNLQITKS